MQLVHYLLSALGAKPQALKIAGTAITATTASTANPLGTLLRQYRGAGFLSSCNLAIRITIGTTSSNGVDLVELEQGNAVGYGEADGIIWPAGTIIGAYNVSGAPASGTLRVTLV